MDEQAQSRPLVDRPFDAVRLCHYFAEHSPIPKLAVEGGTHIVRYVNPAFCALVGRDRSDLLNVPLAECVPEGEDNGCVRLLDRVFRSGTPEVLPEQPHRHPTPAFWSYSVWPILGGPDNRPVGVMIQVTDTTEITRFRRQVTAMNAALLTSSTHQHALAATADSIGNSLRTAIQHKDYLMAVLSHELRTPLSPILTAAAVLLRNPGLDAETRETLEMIHRNVALEARLIDDLLDMTKIERGKVTLDRRPVDLRDVVRLAATVCRPDTEAGALTLHIDCGDQPLVVDADPGRLQQVFWNLFRNAIKFTPPGGRITVRARRNAAHVLAEVTDTGQGIDPDFLPRVFDAFEQDVKNRAGRSEGLGLGLAITRMIVEMHGGAITARSPGPGQGSTFTVRLPALTPATQAIPAVEDSFQPDARRPVRPLRILLVEDHADTARIMRRLLGSDGHTVEWAQNVAAALDLAAQHPFDLLLSDLGLPDGTGTDLMRALRHHGHTFPSIALTGYGREQDLAECRNAGFTAHLTKPVSVRHLYDVIASLIDQ